MDCDGFPFVIGGQSVPHVANKVFTAMAQLDTDTLLKLRTVSTSWKMSVDTHTPLWSRMSLTRAVQQGRTDIAQLIYTYIKLPDFLVFVTKLLLGCWP